MKRFADFIFENETNKQLDKPFRTPGGPKKFAVYVKNDKGNVVKVNFGDPDMEIKRDSEENRKSFRARHGCDDPGPKWKARYWSCKFWSAKNVSDLLGEDCEQDIDEQEKSEDDPCWDGYVQYGMKKKNGKEVPNCVPIEDAVDMLNQNDQQIQEGKQLTTPQGHKYYKSKGKYDNLDREITLDDGTTFTLTTVRTPNHGKRWVIKNPKPGGKRTIPGVSKAKLGDAIDQYIAVKGKG